MSPGDMHALARNRGTFAAFCSEGGCGFGDALVEQIEKTLGPRGLWVFWVVSFRSGKKDVPVGKIKGAGIARVGEMGGEIADKASLEIDFQGVAKGFGEKQEALAVLGPISALAKGGDLFDVRREVIGWVFAGLGRCSGGEGG